MDLISVVVPMYNCESTIRELLTSICNQTYANFEVILINDGSTDDTKSVVEEICEKDKRFILINQENAGAPKARNFGISSAKGKYVYLCDADDLLLPNTLEKLYREIIYANADISIGRVTHFFDDKIEKVSYPVYPRSASLLKQDRFLMCDPIPGTKLYKKSLIDEYNIKFDDVRIAQDLNFYIKFLCVAHNVAVVDDTLYYYRHTDNSISRSYNVDKLLDVKKSIYGIKEFIIKNDLDNMEHSLRALEYIKLGNYIWQLRKRKHMCCDDYNILKNVLCGDIHILKNFDLKFCAAYRMKLIEYAAVKLFNVTLKNI